MAVPPAPDQPSGLITEQRSNDVAPRGTGVLRLAAGLLVLVILAAGAALAWLVSERSGEPADVQAQREKVMSVAQKFVLRVNTYGPEDLAADNTMPDYRAAVDEVISAKLSASFEQSVGAAEATVAQAGLGREAEVYSAGVLVIDSDSATALVAGAFVNSYPDPDDETQRIEDAPLPLRLRLELVKVNGVWLVDAFEPVIDSATSTPDATSSDPALPTPTPTIPPSTPPASPSATEEASQ